MLFSTLITPPHQFSPNSSHFHVYIVINIEDKIYNPNLRNTEEEEGEGDEGEGY